MSNLSFDTILTETESMFDRQWRDMEFCYEVMEQHREMEQFVNECLIKATGNKKAINEMYILNEAAVGDKIKSFFTKIKNFFKKIFDKLGASMNGLFLEQKKYIDKYANIITKCKWQAGDISDVKDRFKGIARIIDAVDNTETAIIGNNMDKFFKGDKIPEDDGNFIDTTTFQSAQNIENAYKDENKRKKIENGATRDKMYEEFTGNDSYWNKAQDFKSFKETDSNGNVDIGATFGAWFDGSKDTVAWSGDEVEDNFQTIINTTYAGQSYLNKLEKIVSSVTKKMDEASKNMEDYHKAQQEKIMQAVKGNAPKQEENNNTQQQEEEREASEKVANTAKTQADNSAAIIYRDNDSFVNEMNIKTSSSSTNNTSDSSSKVQSGTGNKQITSAGDANTKVGQLQASKMNAKGINNTDMGNSDKSDIEKKASELLEVDIYNRQIKINESINISSTIVNKLFASFKNTNTDFFKIIQAHVQWYLSNPGAEKNTENKAPRTKNLNMNAGNEQVRKQTNTNVTPTPTPTGQGDGQPQNPTPTPNK